MTNDRFVVEATGTDCVIPIAEGKDVPGTSCVEVGAYCPACTSFIDDKKCC